MSNTLRILHIETNRTWRGGQQQVVSLMKQLHVMGHTNFLATPPSSVILERIQNGICIPYTVSMRGEWDIFSAIRLAKIIHHIKPDIIHAHSGRAHAMALLSRMFSHQSIPVVVSRRVDFPLSGNLASQWKYQAVDFFLPISEAIATILVESGISREKMEIVYSSVDSERFSDANGDRIREEFSISKDCMVVGNIAICEDRKCQKTILEAVPAVLGRFPDVHFFFVGDGPLREELMAFSHELHIEHRVHFPGFRDDIKHFLDMFDLFLLVPKMEGLGSSILDAQYFSLPVIATPVGGIPEIVIDGETGILIPVNDEHRLAQAMIELLENPDRRKSLGSAGKRRMEELFTAKVMAQRTVAAYQKILDK